VFALVGGTMHGQHFLLGQVVIEDGKHRFLDLTGIGSAADQDQLLGEVDQNEGLGIGAVQLRDRMEARSGNNGEIRAEMLMFPVIPRGQEHVAGKQVLPGGGGDQADVHLVVQVGAGAAVLDIDLLALEVGQQPVMDEIEFFRGHCLVFPAPIDLGGAAGLLHDELIPGRAAGIGSGAHHHRPLVGDEALLPGNDLLIQGRSGQVPVSRGNVSDVVLRQVFLHLTPPA